jgi:hypothetical protein
MSAQTYNQLFTLHGAIMVFLFIIPSVPAALGNFLLPLMLGAKDVAFPKLNLLSASTSTRIGLDLPHRSPAHGRPRHRLDVLHPVLDDDRAPRSSPATFGAVHRSGSRRSSPA